MGAIYHRTVLTGGGAGALDAIDGAGLNDGDLGFVRTSSWELHSYILDADSGLTESSPQAIAPDSNAGSKRWILLYTSALNAPLQNLIINADFGVWSNATIETQGAAVKADDCADDDTADWSKDTNTTLTFDTDHYELAASDAGSNRYAKWTANYTPTVGRLYRLSLDVKDGTASSVAMHISPQSQNPTQTYVKQFTTSSGFVTQTLVFEARSSDNNFWIVLNTGTSGNNVEVKNITVYEVAPGCIAADTAAADGHSKTSTLDAYRVQADSTHLAGYYGLKLVKGDAGAEYYNLNTITHAALLDRYKGRTVAIACYVYDTAGSDDNIKLQIYDGVGTSSSGFATSSSKHWLEITRTIDASATEITPRILCDGDAADVAYISPVVMILGSAIGAGNQAPPPPRLLHLEQRILLASYDGATVSANAAINLTAETEGKLPRAAAILARISAICSTTDKYLALFRDDSGLTEGPRIDTLVANKAHSAGGPCSCNAGTLHLARDDTFTSVSIYISAVEVI